MHISHSKRCSIITAGDILAPSPDQTGSVTADPPPPPLRPASGRRRAEVPQQLAPVLVLDCRTVVETIVAVSQRGAVGVRAPRGIQTAACDVVLGGRQHGRPPADGRRQPFTAGEAGQTGRASRSHTGARAV